MSPRDEGSLTIILIHIQSRLEARFPPTESWDFSFVAVSEIHLPVHAIRLSRRDPIVTHSIHLNYSQLSE